MLVRIGAIDSASNFFPDNVMFSHNDRFIVELSCDGAKTRSTKIYRRRKSR